MARRVRVEFEGAAYHVMCRGDRRENIFEDDLDRALFLETLGEVCGRTGWKIHAYVLMSNHYHWLLETPRANLVAGMRWFQSCYTARYNRRHRKVGHLFQGRYKAMLVEPAQSAYFATVADYIHLNPARVRLPARRGGGVKTYRWSSLPCYLASPRQRPVWLEVSRVLGELGLQDKPGDRRTYGRRLEERAREGLKAEQLQQVRRGWLLGSEAFRDQVLDWMEKKAPRARSKSSPRAIRSRSWTAAGGEDYQRNAGTVGGERERSARRSQRGLAQTAHCASSSQGDQCESGLVRGASW